MWPPGAPESMRRRVILLSSASQASTNGVESYWSMLKRAHKGTFHKLSPKHLDRYVQEFAGKHNVRDLETLAQMRDTVARFIGRNLIYLDLIENKGLRSGSRTQ